MATFNPDEHNLTSGQRWVIDNLTRNDLPVDAEGYAIISFGRDISELGAEELDEIPDFLLQPWLAKRDGTGS